jgi:hypothetical protein
VRHRVDGWVRDHVLVVGSKCRKWQTAVSPCIGLVQLLHMEPTHLPLTRGPEVYDLATLQLSENTVVRRKAQRIGSSFYACQERG